MKRMRDLHWATRLAATYVAISAVLAAVVLLTDLTYINGWFALIVLNLPASVPAYFLAFVIVVFAQPVDQDLLWVRVVCYLMWMTMVVTQAVLFQAAFRKRGQAGRPSHGRPT